jgi:hypothetical protein
VVLKQNLFFLYSDNLENPDAERLAKCYTFRGIFFSQQAIAENRSQTQTETGF